VTDPQFRAALAAHGYTLDGTGEILELAQYVGPFSARPAQIGRNVDHFEREWMAAHPSETAGPALQRSWDARAWAEGRPDKVTPRPGADLDGRWRTELAALGYRDRERPVALTPAPVGALDRDGAVERVLGRLAAARSAWNAADVRGEVEQLIAAHGIVADRGVRAELAEDLTARTVESCVRLRDSDGVPVVAPEHVRALTSQPVLDVEADLTGRLAARSAVPARNVSEQLRLAEVVTRGMTGLDAGQATAAVALAGDWSLLVVEGAAGAGKTTTLAAARQLVEASGSRQVIVTPTLKAAKVATAEVGGRAGSAAWLVYQHGWRWSSEGSWTRLAVGQADPVTGRNYTGPSESALLWPGDVLVVDEAGMLDQDTTFALLTVADECQVRVALLGDRHQLAAVGRGGVLDLAADAVDPAAHLILDGVHRFTRTEPTGRTAPDTEYADLTLAMRTGDDPGAVFDALVARGQIRIHPDAPALKEKLAGIAAAPNGSERAAVVADTLEQVAELNAAIRDRLVAAGRVDDGWVVTTRAGQRIGAGDRVATRRNDQGLGVANRDLWVVTAISRRGAVVVTPADTVPPGVAAADLAAGVGARVLPPRLRDRAPGTRLRQHGARRAGRHRPDRAHGDRRVHRGGVGLRGHDPRPPIEHRPPGRCGRAGGAGAVDRGVRPRSGRPRPRPRRAACRGRGRLLRPAPSTVPDPATRGGPRRPGRGLERRAGRSVPAGHHRAGARPAAAAGGTRLEARAAHGRPAGAGMARVAGRRARRPAGAGERGARARRRRPHPAAAAGRLGRSTRRRPSGSGRAAAGTWPVRAATRGGGPGR
jgi:thymidine kinase